MVEQCLGEVKGVAFVAAHQPVTMRLGTGEQGLGSRGRGILHQVSQLPKGLGQEWGRRPSKALGGKDGIAKAAIVASGLKQPLC